MHLNAEELIDLAEGARPESSAPHLAACAPCRAQLEELRAMMSAAKEVDVPEPSPLFWDRLSSRVSAAVAAEAGDARLQPPHSFAESVAALFRLRAFQATVGVAAVVLISVVVGSGPRAPVLRAPSLSVDVADAGAPADLLDDVAAAGDASLMVVASLTDGVDMDTAREAGLAPRGSAEYAITHMSGGELRELRRLLTEELARPEA